MSSEAQQTARAIVHDQVLASLGTLHGGEASVSMVPYAILPNGSGLVIHVSRLSTHTADMVAHPRVGLLVIAAGSSAIPQATARVSISADAEALERGSREEAVAREVYLARFPDSAHMFELGDFSLFVLRPLSVRVIGGFGRAATLGAEQFADAIRT